MPINNPQINYNSDLLNKCKVKLIDFGFMIQVDAKSGKLTQQAAIKDLKGTIFYHAPEILNQLF